MAVLPFRLLSGETSRIFNAFDIAVTAENPRWTIVWTVLWPFVCKPLRIFSSNPNSYWMTIGTNWWWRRLAWMASCKVSFIRKWRIVLCNWDEMVRNSFGNIVYAIWTYISSRSRNLRPTSAANHKHNIIICIQYNWRAHRRQWPFARLNEVCWRWR